MYKNSMSRQEKEEKIKKMISDAEQGIENYCNSEESIKEYLKFTANLHSYSYHNTALIKSQFPGAYAVGSYKFWNDNGYHVKRGESGIGILVPVRGKTKFVNADGECKPIEQATPEEKMLIKSGDYEVNKGRLYYKIGYVFDITQTNAKKEDLPKILANCWLEGEVKNYNVYHDALLSFAQKNNISVNVSETEMGNTKGVAYPETKEISLNKRNSELQNIKTLTHEIGHVLLHGQNGNKLERAEKEFQAELVAYTVCSYFGIDTSDYSIPYIKNWTINATLNDKKALLKGVTTAAQDIITHIETYLIDHREEALTVSSEEEILTDKKETEPVVTLTVAECSEYHSWGEFYDGIMNVDHAISLFNSIPPERMNGIRSIGINIHTPGTEDYEDTEADILIGNTIDLNDLEYYPGIKNNEKAISYISELIEKLPEIRVLGSFPGIDSAKEKKNAVPASQSRTPYVLEFTEKTEKMFHEINGNTTSDIESIVMEHLNEIIEENKLDVSIKDLVISGSRCRGLESENSDLDIVVEYTGDISEDTLFNYFHEDDFKIDGVPVDINPITEGKTGTLENYLPTVEEYLLTKQQTEQKTEQISFDFDTTKNTKVERKQKIEDFGKKIGGAKKDLWKERGLRVSDLIEMNAAEKEKYVKKDNVWKKPDYSKMIKDGTPVHVAFFIKKVRDSISSTPAYKFSDETEEDRIVRQNDYIEMITDIRNALKEVKNDSDICNFYDNFLNTGKYVCKKEHSYYLQQTEKGVQVTNKMLKAMHENAYSISGYDREIEKKQFGKSKEEKIGSSTSKKTRKKRYKPKQLENIERVGPDNGMVEGKTTGEDYLNEFGFLGGEFGNWMTENDRQASLDLGYDALCDLARALNISNQDISLNNRLSIAFGSRGSGSAVAHYEPMREVINLTKMRGAGSLAHEWGHAFDDIIAKENGLKGMMTENRNGVLKSMSELVDCMKFRDSTKEETELRFKKDIEESVKRLDSWINHYIPDNKLTEEQLVLKQEIREELISEARNCSVNCTYAVNKEGDAALDKLNQFVKDVTGHVIRKSERINVYYALYSLENIFSHKDKPYREKTEFYKNSIRMDSLCSKEDKGYWQSTVEMFARSFACYIYDKLKEQGIRNDYLCGHANSAVMFDYQKKDMPLVKAYPEGEEREKINKCMDKVFNECLEKNIFKEPINYIKHRSR